jgi:cellulose synthase catalytic subunit (UDP-forming)
MSGALKKIVAIIVLIVGVIAILYLFAQIPTQDLATATFTSGSSIADYASTYSGVLSRPLFPDTSLYLPLIAQVAISCVLIVGMVLTALFFPKARRFVMLLTVATSVRHLLWRGLDTLDFSSPLAGLISVLIYGAELTAFFAMAIGYFQVWGQTDHKPVSLSRFTPEQLPTVDIMVCTYGEPVSVLYRSLVGCNGIDYPKKTVYLCDDGNRPEMRELAERLGVTYISREKNVNAKAGNLNNALQYSQGELVLVFDADHVPCKNFLNETVGFFVDDRLGFVQTPQHFFTDDPFQRNLLSTKEINNEQDLFFHVIQPGNDYWGSAFFAGSGAIFRRAALQSVGGFAVETITEDVHTGMRIHGMGWKSLYYNRDLAAGMAQESFADVIKQRLRWARGMTQIYCLENPMFARGLSIAQRLCYFTGIWYFFHGLPRLIFMVAPLFFLLFGYKTVNSGFVEVLIYYLPSFLATTLGYTIVSRGVRHSFWSEVYESCFCIYLSLTTFLTFLSPRRAKFRVTPKGGLTEKLNFNWRIVFPQVMIAALTIVGIGMAIVRAIYTPEYAGGIYTNLAWSLYNLVLLLGAIYVAQERPQFRLAPRIFRRVRCELKLLDGSIAVGYTTNISESGVALVFDEPVPITGTVLLKIMDWDINETTILSVQVIRSIVDERNRHYVGFQVVNRTEEQHQKLVRHMFGSAEIWAEDYVYTPTTKSFWQLIMTPFRLAGTLEEPLRRAAPRFKATLSCVLNINNQFIIGFSNEVSETGISVFLKKGIPLDLGQPVRVRIQWPSGEISELASQVKRVEDAGGGQIKLGLEFIQMTSEQRVELIRQIYRPKDRLIRVAPGVSKFMNCTLIPVDGSAPVHGMTQEISEQGLIMHLKERSNLQIRQKVWIQLSWDGQQTERYPGEVIDVSLYYENPVALIYFDGLDMKTLDQLSLRLHEPEENKAFKTLIGE